MRFNMLFSSYSSEIINSKRSDNSSKPNPGSVRQGATAQRRPMRQGVNHLRIDPWSFIN
jgi:hypothetical protein